MITASTPASERHALLAALSRGDIRAVASVRVLDEGWDVPTAKLGIVLGDRHAEADASTRSGSVACCDVRVMRSRRYTRSSPPGRTSSSRHRSGAPVSNASPRDNWASVL